MVQMREEETPSLQVGSLIPTNGNFFSHLVFICSFSLIHFVYAFELQFLSLVFATCSCSSV